MEPAAQPLAISVQFKVHEYIYDAHGTRIRLDMGNNCFADFHVPCRVALDKWVTFTAVLKDKA